MKLRPRISLIVVAVAVFFSACTRGPAPAPGVMALSSDRQTNGSSAYNLSIDSNRVGSYASATKSGGGYFYDEVLEYRVWIENGATQRNGGNDYFAAFAQYEIAEKFSKSTPDAEPPLVLVRQQEWIDEPARGHFVPKKGERITEWQAAWLRGHKRTANSIEEFMKHPQEEGPP